jgi:Ala-tRNA(Pro) deacylase
MAMDESSLLVYLREHQIDFKRVEHPPVLTCEEADRIRMPLPAVHTKNLFLHDEGRAHYYLVMMRCGTRLDVKALGRLLGVRKLHFCNAEELQSLLGINPGAVTALAVINDPIGRVELLIDVEIWGEAAFTCHPLVNTATLVLARQEMEKFFTLCAHPPRLAQLTPERS